MSQEEETSDSYITSLIILLNIIVFIIMVIKGVDFWNPSSESLLNFGANYRPLILNGEWWRLVTCCFVHIGIIHLLVNLGALYYIGELLEPLLGVARFTTAYLLTGIAGSMASIYWHENTVSAGASGAIFGMYGVFLALLTTNLIKKNQRKELLSSIGIFIAYNLLYGILKGKNDGLIKGEIDNAAHIGGLLAGLLCGYFYYFGLKNQKLSISPEQTVVPPPLPQKTVVPPPLPKHESIPPPLPKIIVTPPPLPPEEK